MLTLHLIKQAGGEPIFACIQPRLGSEVEGIHIARDIARIPPDVRSAGASGKGDGGDQGGGKGGKARHGARYNHDKAERQANGAPDSIQAVAPTTKQAKRSGRSIDTDSLMIWR